MLQSPTISRSRPEQRSKDYAFLRAQGLEYIQQIAGRVWTDYNLHDPGVTMLEALCYAITELGYRIQEPVPDLLYSHPDGVIDWDNLFFPAHRILPNCVLTEKDYRKLLIDLPGIRNVYIEKATRSEQNFFCQFKLDENDVLQPEIISYQDGGEAILPKGLYTLLLEFGSDPKLGDLNSNLVNGNIELGGDTYLLSLAFPYWDDLDGLWAGPKSVVDAKRMNGSLIVQLFEDTYYDFFSEIEVQFDGGYVEDKFPLRIKILEGPPGYNETVLKAIIEEELNTSFNGFLPFFMQYQTRVKAVEQILKRAKECLQARRNLCEDFFEFKALRQQEVVIFANVELKPEADPEVTLASIYFAMDQFFSPHVRFYRLAELLEEGKTLDQIFEGPLLTHGFLKNEQLDALKQRNVIYTSDLINIIMDLEGVQAVYNLRINNYIDNVAIIVGEANCIRLESSVFYKPRYSLDRSLSGTGASIICERYGYELTGLDETAIRNTFYKLADGDKTIYEVQNHKTPFPDGTPKPISEYFSVQHDLPATYGIGTIGLRPSETPQRQAHAHQLKGYLLFFEQILANFFSQLAHLQNYFSMSETVDRTCFYQPLYDVPRVNDLLHNFTEQTNSWASFQSDGNNAYIQLLQKASEGDAIFQDRRNRFLDHVLARFAESFADYSIVLFDLLKDKEKSQRQLISDKLNYLKCLPELTACRANAFNYSPVIPVPNKYRIWDTNNISGFEKRVCKRLGFKLCKRRNLAINKDTNKKTCFEIYDETDGDGKPGKRFRYKSEKGSILLSSSLHYATEPLAWKEIDTVIQFGSDKTNYKIQLTVNGKYYFNLEDNTGEVIARRIQYFKTQALAEAAIMEIVNGFIDLFYPEGLHLVEHILLRPKNKGMDDNNSDRLLPVLQYDRRRIKDPYSFQVTIVLPTGYMRDFSVEASVKQGVLGGERLQNLSFRQYVERVIDEELPAHVLANICWRDVDSSSQPEVNSLNNFEKSFQYWLEVVADPNSTDLDKLNAQRDLSNQIMYCLPKAPAVKNKPVYTPEVPVVVVPVNPVIILPQTPVNIAPVTPVIVSPQPPFNVIPGTPVVGTPQTPIKGIPQMPGNATPGTPVKGIPQMPGNITPGTPVKGIPQIPQKGTSETPGGKNAAPVKGEKKAQSKRPPKNVDIKKTLPKPKSGKNRDDKDKP